MVLLSRPAQVHLFVVGVGVQGQAPFRIHDLNTLCSDPVPIRSLCDNGTDLFHTLIVNAKFDLAFLDATLNRSETATVCSSSASR